MSGYHGLVAPQLTAAENGWFEWSDASAPLPKRSKVLVRVVEANDGRFHLDGLRIEGHVSAELLRSVPLGRIEAAANAQLHPGTAPGRAKRSVTIPAKLRTGGRSGYGDAFYDAVARAYQHLAHTSPRPIGELAESNRVPLTTAQRWVREARRRGKLPPGRPGKAG